MFEGFERRDYQVRIADTAQKANTLIALPAGLGQTIIAIQVAEGRLVQYGDGRLVVLAPTRPLVIQHHTAFTDHFKGAVCSHLTGQIRPDTRLNVWAGSRFVFATPQVVANDVHAGGYSLSNACLMVFDEAHRCVKDHDYTELAMMCRQTAQNPLIPGLTASPSGEIDRVQEICQNYSSDRSIRAR